MVRNAAWSKNNRREMKKTLGRFLAIVAIVALGVSMFIGLNSAKPSMVNTCNGYLNDTGFYDLQLISSIAFDRTAPQAFRSLDGVAAVEGAVSADLMAAMDGNELVFKTHTLLSTVNGVHLTAGRMPEAANEVLADDLTFSRKDLGKEITTIHQEDSLFTQDTFTIVGLCNSPQYLNMSRGSTSLGNGTVKGFLFLPAAAYHTNYWTEIYIRLSGERDAFDPDYQDYLSTWEAPLLEQMESQGKTRLNTILLDAREELGEGWQTYYDGMIEYEQARAEAEAELEDARLQLEDAALQLEDGRKELEEGEDTLVRLKTNPYSLPELAAAKAELDEGRKQLEDGEQQFWDGVKQLESMRRPLEMLIRTAEESLGSAQIALKEAQNACDEAEAAWRQTEATIQEQLLQLYEPVAQLEQALQEAQADLAAKEAQLAELEASGASAEEIAAAALAVETARTQVSAGQTAYDLAKASYDAQTEVLHIQLEAARETFDRTQALLAESQATVDKLNATIENGKQQLADAETQLLEAQEQLEEGRIQLEEGEAALQQAISSAIATAETQLEEGRATLADGEQEYADGLKEYEKGKAEAEEEFAKAEKELANGLRDLQEAQLELDRMADPSYYVLTPTSNNGFVSFDNDTSIVDAIANVFPIFFLLVAALVCSSTMSRMVEEQRTQNGTLKALGYSDGKIMMRYAVYAGFAAIIGTAIGVVLGTYLFPFVIWEAYKILYHFAALDYVFSWTMAAIAAVAALLCCCGAACLAAWSDLQLMPAQLMRPKAPKAGKRILLERITPLWNSLGFLAKVSLRNIFRYKKRLFMMLLGTGGCLALLLAGLGLRDSISNVAEDQFGLITMYDYSVIFSEHQTAREQEAFRTEYADQLEHCVYASYETLEVPTEHGTKSVTFIATDDPAMDEILGLTWQGQDLGYPTGDGLYVSHALAEDAGLQVGDLLPIQLESKALLEIPITGIFINYVSHYAYLTADGYETWFGLPPELNTAFATVRPENDLHSVNAELQQREGVVAVTMVQELKETVANAIGSLDAIVILVVACAAALAFVVGYNLININITERIREIATIKVLGFYRNEAHAYVFRESILLTLMGTVVGVPLGIWLHGFIMNAVKVDFVCFQVQIAPLSFVLGIAVTILVTLIVNKMLGKKIDKINMAESLKSVE